jgi:uncharacterized protein (DUF952 family)
MRAAGGDDAACVPPEAMTGHPLAMTLVFHIAQRAEWEAADLADPGYAPEAFAAEGFIHCSTRDQVLASGERHLPGHQDLLLVALEADDLGADLRFEPSPSVGQDFPHLYRRILRGDVRGLASFARDEGGAYTFPDRFEPPA